VADKRAKVNVRLGAIEERLAALEQAAAPAPRAAPAPIPDAERFWALAGLQERLGADADAGAVVYAGSASLPSGEEYIWQEGASVAALLDARPEALVPALAALGHRVRLMLVQAVLSGRRTVGELEALETLGTSGQLYHHLRQLVAAGWLQTAGRGRYAVPPERVVPFLVVLAAVGPSPPVTGDA
jgi:hypothetical protein